MKMLMCGVALSIGFVASDVQAEVTVNIDGAEIPVSTLMDNCKNMTGDPAAKVACFNALSEMLNAESEGGGGDNASVTQALDDLRAVAQYQDADSGLSISGSGCDVQFVYFNNYFHISRRNVSTIDLFSAKFDASDLQHDQTTEVRGAQAPLLKGVMGGDVMASMRGGMALDSNEQNFSPKSARTTMDVYANEVVSQLPAREDQAFEFVLVHPQRSQASDDIWNAFEAFVTACKG